MHHRTLSRVHPDEVVVDLAAMRRLVDAQFPSWRSRPLRPLPPTGTDNQLFRLGEDLLVRTPRIGWAAAAAEWEHTWLPRLASHLPIPVPVPVGLGRPGEGFPWHWTVVPWFDGENPTPARIDPEAWAVGLGEFVVALRDAPGMDAPVRTEGRGGPLAALDEIVRTWLPRVDPTAVDPSALAAVWRDALDAPGWGGESCWFHGDLHAGNLLVRERRLTAVIDWGVAGRGDPAVELNAMWGPLPSSVVELYRSTVGLDEAAYRRGRGFALQPALTGWIYYRDTAPELSAQGLATLRALVASL